MKSEAEKFREAAEYFVKAIEDSEELINEVPVEYVKTLREQQEHFKTALIALDALIFLRS